jgi:hypothetical protein
VRHGRNRKKRRGGPTEKLRDRTRQQRADPAEIPLYVPVAVELSVTLGGERAGEEDSKEKEDYPADLASERGLREPIVPVPARAS